MDILVDGIDKGLHVNGSGQRVETVEQWDWNERGEKLRIEFGKIEDKYKE